MLAGVLNVSHHLISFINFPSNLGCFGFQDLKVVDNIVVIQDPSLGFIETGQQVLLKVSEPQLKLSLQLEKIRPLLVNVGSLGLEDLVETLSLKTGPGHREVDECHSGANVGRKLDSWISGGEEDNKAG